MTRRSARERWPVIGHLLLQFTHRLVPVVRQPASHHALKLAALSMPGEALEPGTSGGSAAGADGVPPLLQVMGRHEGRVVPAEQLLGCGGFAWPELRAVGCGALVGAPRPMMVRQAISVGFLDRAAKDKAAWIMFGS